jgi:hypothetical protein
VCVFALPLLRRFVWRAQMTFAALFTRNLLDFSWCPTGLGVSSLMITAPVQRPSEEEFKCLLKLAPSRFGMKHFQKPFRDFSRRAR